MVIDVGKIIKYEEDTKKVRLISIKNNKVLICNYNGFFMFPGGKIDGHETDEEAIRREIREELDYDIRDLQEYLTINNYAENYLSRSSNIPKNKKITTKYFITEDDITITESHHLSEKERSGYFETLYINIDELIELLSSAKLTYKQTIYAKEVLTVLKYYLKKDRLIDLHTHTNLSDGEFSPNEVISQAISKNLSAIAITDHDTIKGLSSINFDNPNIEIIPGIEISVKRETGRMHILGLGIDYKNKDLIDFLREMKEINRHNVKNIINYLKEIGIKLDDFEISELMKKEKNVGRPDIAKIIKEGYVSTVQEAFDKYLIEAFTKSRHLNRGHTYKDVLEVINNANGLSVLAHPNSLELENTKFEELIKDMKDNKLAALEVYHSYMSQSEREYYMMVADKYNLMYSGGSDYHGASVKPDIKLATGKDNIYLTNLPILKVLGKRVRNNSFMLK